MIPALIVAVFALFALAFVLAPLLRGPRADTDAGNTRAEEAQARKRAALSALVDLETEHEIGKLTASDLELLRSEYELEALASLRELDALGAVHVDDELEAEIAAMKARLVCPNCGEPRSPGEPCPKCQTVW